MSTSVAVLGPNGINDATFHVHAASCADVQKRRYWRSEAHVYQYDDADEAVLDLMGDFVKENDYTDEEGLAAYRQEIRFFPCIRWETTSG